MAAFKDKKNGSWYVQFRYTDWRGERQQKLKRGFATKKEAQAWEREFLIHDLRHSHVSLLINMGYSAVAIGNRVGHESVEITYRYAHLFPTVQKEMADKLNVERSN